MSHWMIARKNKQEKSKKQRQVLFLLNYLFSDIVICMEFINLIFLKIINNLFAVVSFMY